MKERPILFSAPMVRAILDGTKTQTRRLVKLPMTRGILGAAGWRPFDLSLPNDRVSASHFSPYGAPGDRLWVREAHYRFGHWELVPGVRTKGGRQKWRFVADSGETLFVPPQGMRIRLGRHHKDPSTPAWHVRLARFMPRALCRTVLEVTSVRVERLHEITEFDAIAEGVEMAGERLERWRNYSPPEREGGSRGTAPTARESFFSLWEAINGTESLAANPWVWVVGFKRVEVSGG